MLEAVNTLVVCEIFLKTNRSATLQFKDKVSLKVLRVLGSKEGFRIEGWN
jgi:hypothetical protein